MRLVFEAPVAELEKILLDIALGTGKTKTGDKSKQNGKDSKEMAQL